MVTRVLVRLAAVGALAFYAVRMFQVGTGLAYLELRRGAGLSLREPVPPALNAELVQAAYGWGLGYAIGRTALVVAVLGAGYLILRWLVRGVRTSRRSSPPPPP